MALRDSIYYFWMILVGSIAFAHPALGQTRLGLHVTQEELNIWRQRANSGPYRVQGDASTNSPGDWTRIVANRNGFASNPSNGRWIAPVTSGGCVEDGPSTYGWPEGGKEGGVAGEWARKIRDAAFHNMVMGVTTDHAAIKTELLWIASQPWAQFGNPNGIWCFGRIYDVAPAVGVAMAMSKLILAYDYMGRNAFTQTERDILDRWFFDAADFWRGDVEASINEIYANRLAGDYTIVNHPDPCNDNLTVPYVGAPAIQGIPAKYYNNRRGGVVTFSAMVGIYLQQAGRSYTNGRWGTLASIISNAKLYGEEFVRFSVFPQGYIGDMERGEDWLPDLGWAYSSAALFSALSLADTFARAGDTSLYTYNTALGACNSVGTINDGGSRQGQNRDLLFALQSYMKYITDVYARYQSNSGNQDYRIDGRHARNGSTESYARDTWQAIGNVFYKDTFVKQAYTRTHPGSIPYPASPTDNVPQPWQGTVPTLPGALFMFGQMEGLVAPYATGQGVPPPPPPPPPPSLSCSSVGLNNFVGCYYDDIGFSNLLLSRTDDAINFDWGAASPDPRLSADTFSVKWEGDFDFAQSGTYRFSTSTDDGMRLYVDGALLIDAWLEQPPTAYTADLNLSSGRHRIRVEYYENGGGATAKASWALIGSSQPNTPGNLTVSIAP